MRRAAGTLPDAAIVLPTGKGACPQWIVDEIRRVYEQDPRPALGALLGRLRRADIERWAITPAGRAALEEAVS